MSLKIAFLDRDGVINEHQPRGSYYVTRVELFKFNQGIFDVLTTLESRGFKFVVLTNQRGIAAGQMTSSDLASIHEHMKSGLREKGIEILDIFFCPHGKDECECRKPKPGMLQEAAKKYDIDLANSLFISDSPEDVEMGKKFGIGKNILVETNHPEQSADLL